MDWTGDQAAFTLDRYTHLFQEQREASAGSVADWQSEASRAFAPVVVNWSSRGGNCSWSSNGSR